MYQKCFRRLLDVALSSFAMILLFPFCSLRVVMIELDSKGAVLFPQKRLGICKFNSVILRFRTMHIDAPEGAQTHLLKNTQQCITRCGEILRKKSLNKLPQYFNALKGDISLIWLGSALCNQFDLIAIRDRYRREWYNVGITGLVLLYNLDKLEIEGNTKIERIYAQNISFLLDVKYFLRTVKVCSGECVVEGIKQARHDMEENR